MKEREETVRLIVRALFLGAILVLCLVYSPYAMPPCPEDSWPDKLTGKCVRCPGNQWFNPEIRKCVTPGDDPTGETDRNFIRQIMFEHPENCSDGWCCPDKTSLDCLDLKDERSRVRCLKKNKCRVYGE